MQGHKKRKHMKNKLAETESQTQELLSKMNQMTEVNYSERPVKVFVKESYLSKFEQGFQYDLHENDSEHDWLKMNDEGIQTYETDKRTKNEIPRGILQKVTFPTGKGKECSAGDLIKRIQNSISLVFHFKSPEYLFFSSLYAFATWMYDIHPVLGYIGITAGPDSGKSCLLDAFKELVYYGCAISGSATESAFFRIIDSTRSTILMDEAQRDDSNPNDRYHKILTQGNKSNGSVDLSAKFDAAAGDYSPKSFNVYGPKIFAARQLSEDVATISRTYKVELERIEKRDLPKYKTTDDSWLSLVAELRNDLLFYRQKRLLRLVQVDNNLESELFKSLDFDTREIQIYSWLFEECPKSLVPDLIASIEYQKENKREDIRWTLEAEVLIISYRLSLKAKDVIYLSQVQGELKESYPAIHANCISVNHVPSTSLI